MPDAHGVPHPKRYQPVSQQPSGGEYLPLGIAQAERLYLRVGVQLRRITILAGVQEKVSHGGNIIPAAFLRQGAFLAIRGAGGRF